MSKQVTKTNNDSALLESKIQLRLQSLPDKQTVKILEAFGGEGVLWGIIKRRTGRDIKILSIDKEKYNRVQLQGDNLKFISSFNLQEFDIIDLDAWGSPFPQLEIVFRQKYSGIVHGTFIQSMQGNVNKKLLFELGFTDRMIKKIPSLFNKDGFGKFKQYLAMHGVTRLTFVSQNNKNYFYFHLDNPLK